MTKLLLLPAHWSSLVLPLHSLKIQFDEKFKKFQIIILAIYPGKKYSSKVEKYQGEKKSLFPHSFEGIFSAQRSKSKAKQPLTISLLLLSVVVAGAVILDAVGELVVRRGREVLVPLAPLVDPGDLLVLAVDRTVEVLEGARVTALGLAPPRPAYQQER